MVNFTTMLLNPERTGAFMISVNNSIPTDETMQDIANRMNQSLTSHSITPGKNFSIYWNIHLLQLHCQSEQYFVRIDQV